MLILYRFIMYGLSVAFNWGFALTQCLFFGALISSTDPGKQHSPIR